MDSAVEWLDTTFFLPCLSETPGISKHIHGKRMAFINYGNLSGYKSTIIEQSYQTLGQFYPNENLNTFIQLPVKEYKPG